MKKLAYLLASFAMLTGLLFLQNLVTGYPPVHKAEAADEPIVKKMDKLATKAKKPVKSPKNAIKQAYLRAEKDAKAFIYFKESSNTLHSVNYQGCYGLGQDCNDVLRFECPEWKTDRACQEKFWESYMKRRYGSWQKAKAFWLARVPINNKDVGNWW